MNLSCMSEFLISNGASVASEKILEKIRGISYSTMEMERNNHSYVRLQFDVHNQEIQKKILVHSLAVGLFHEWA